MVHFINTFLPFMIALIVSMSFYYIMDKEERITNKVSPYIPICKEYKPIFCFGFMIVIEVLIVFLGISVFSFSEVTLNIINGLIVGFISTLMIKLREDNPK